MIAKVKRPHLSQVQLRTLERLAERTERVRRGIVGAESSTMLALERQGFVDCVVFLYGITHRGRQFLDTRRQKIAR